MEKICKKCYWRSYEGGNLLCCYHRNSLGNPVRVKEDSYCDKFTPMDTSNNIKNNDGCFLTSACVNFLGLPDDCKELTTLRNFRDNYLKQTHQGQILVKNYYEIAPAILEKIEKSINKKDIFAYIYKEISLSVKAIEQKNYEKAVCSYKNMVEKLIREVNL
ncbi:MAG: hypothetical protein IKA99_06710, partial [Clostridia bacterium]|nr:hypothetical protein [Clostridia bacterium]